MNDFNKIIGNTCKIWRQSMGITIKEMASAVGCSQGNISFFENGKNDSVRIFLTYCSKGFEPWATGIYTFDSFRPVDFKTYLEKEFK